MTPERPNDLPSRITELTCTTCHGLGTVWDGPRFDADAQLEDCPDCDGGIQRRDYLRESFNIALGVSHMIPERKHLEAIVTYCRQLVSASMAASTAFDEAPRKPVQAVEYRKEVA